MSRRAPKSAIYPTRRSPQQRIALLSLTSLGRRKPGVTRRRRPAGPGSRPHSIGESRRTRRCAYARAVAAAIGYWVMLGPGWSGGRWHRCRRAGGGATRVWFRTIHSGARLIESASWAGRRARTFSPRSVPPSVPWHLPAVGAMLGRLPFSLNVRQARRDELTRPSCGALAPGNRHTTLVSRTGVRPERGFSPETTSPVEPPPFDPFRQLTSVAIPTD
jgi:hypothetical protein